MTDSDEDSSLQQALERQKAAWDRRPAVRAIYRGWHRDVVAALSPGTGTTVELGAGIGQFKAFHPPTVATDVRATSWADAIADAHELPFADATLANLVLIDVFHHLAEPSRFLDEAARVLAPGGRVVIVDPYCSPVSSGLYRRFHHERTDLSASPFRADAALRADPLAGNQALATLVFYRHRRTYESRWPHLPLVAERRFALFAYPLSGGFSKRRLLPAALSRPLMACERMLAPLAPLLAFRCLIVLERRAHTGAAGASHPGSA